MTTLTHPILGDKEFDDDHAERILNKENNGGWELKIKASDITRNKGKVKKSDK